MRKNDRCLFPRWDIQSRCIVKESRRPYRPFSSPVCRDANHVVPSSFSICSMHHSSFRRHLQQANWQGELQYFVAALTWRSLIFRIQIWGRNSALTVHLHFQSRHLHLTRPCFSFLTFRLRHLVLRHQTKNPRFRSLWPHQTLLLISLAFSFFHFRSIRIYRRQLLWHFLLWSSLQICLVNFCGQNTNRRQSSVD